MVVEILIIYAGVAELVDAMDSKSISRKGVGVRAPPPVQISHLIFKEKYFIFFLTYNK